MSRSSDKPTGSPIGYFAKTLQKPERKWSTRDLEAFAIVSAVKHWQDILYGFRFIIETDHKNLTFMQTDPSARVIRWRHFLSEFNFVIVHIPGNTNVMADMLSRCCALTRSQSRSNEPSEVPQKSTLETEDDDRHPSSGLQGEDLRAPYSQ